MSGTDFFVFGLYLVGTLGIGFFFAGRNRDYRDMFAAGGQSPWWVAGLSGFMTVFSAGTFVVWGGIAYEHGFVAVTINFTFGLAALATGYFVAGRWKELGIQTPSEYVRLRFGSGAVHLYTWFMMLLRMIGSGTALYAFSVLFCALVPLAGGHPFSDPSTGNLSVAWAAIGFGIVIVLYTMAGGLWAVLMTDVLQFIILNLAVLFLVILITADVGGAGNVVAQAPADFFHLTGGGYGWFFIIGWMTANFFSFGAEWAFAQRFISVPSPGDARRGAYLFGFLYLVSPLLWLAPPMIYRVVDPSAPPEQAYILAARAVLPAGMIGLVLAAMFSATASLVSSQLNVFAGVLTKMASLRLVIEHAAREIWLGRAFTCLLGATLITVAVLIPFLGGAENVIISATSLMVGPLLAPSLVGLWSRRIGLSSVVWTMAIAIGVGVFFQVALRPDGFLSSLPGLADLSDWIQANGPVADLVVGVVVPVVVLSLVHVGGRGDDEGALRVDAQRARTAEFPAPAVSDLPLRIVALALGASGLLMGVLFYLDTGSSGTVLLVFAVVLLTISAALGFLSKRRPPQAGSSRNANEPVN